MDFLQAVPLGALADVGGWITAFGVTLYAARLVITGKLVPRSTHDDTVAALEIERQRNALLVEQNGRLTDAMETVEAFVQALPQPQGQRQLPPGRSRQGGGR